MKLAEALIQRADIQTKVEQMRTRLQHSALVQEGEQPPENPQELLAELDQLLHQLQVLIAQINRTNLQARLAENVTLTDALARRDTLATHQCIISGLADAASERVERYGRSEIRKLSTVDVAALRRQANELAKQRRELDVAIQGLNWTTDLLE